MKGFDTEQEPFTEIQQDRYPHNLQKNVRCMLNDMIEVVIVWAMEQRFEQTDTLPEKIMLTFIDTAVLQ